MGKDNMNFSTISKLDDFFSKVDLYQDVAFEIYKKDNNGNYELDKNELQRFLKVANPNLESIDAYCIFCNKEYSFDTEIDCSSSRYFRNVGYYIKGISLGDNVFIDFSKNGNDNSLLPKTVGDTDLYDIYVSFINYTFSCNKNSKHIYKMFTVFYSEKGKICIRKIGQFPSKIDIWGFGFEKYKKQLNKFDSYSDFRKAELCMSDGFFAGAYTYLRRVFEKMLDYYCKEIELSNRKAETKIEACKDKFDNRIIPMLNNLYIILSKGIHSLDDEESEDYYIYLRSIIEMQLEHVKELSEKEEQTQRLKSSIDSIASKIKKD